MQCALYSHFSDSTGLEERLKSTPGDETVATCRQEVFRRDSLDLSIDVVPIGQPSPDSTNQNAPMTSSSLVSPNSDRNFHQVFKKISCEMGAFSIIDEELSPVANFLITSAAAEDMNGIEQMEGDIVEGVLNGSSNKPPEVDSGLDGDLANADESPVEIVRRLLSENKRWPIDDPLPASLLRLWMGQLLVALAHLHAEGVIVRSVSRNGLLKIMCCYCIP